MGKKSREKKERRNNAPFHITVGATMQGDSGDIAFQTLHQTRLVKAALFYSDKVTLCNPVVHMLLAVERMRRFSTRQQAQLMRVIAPTLLENPDQLLNLEQFLAFLDAMLGEKQLPRHLRTQTRGFEVALKQIFEEMRQKTSEVTQSYGLDDLANLTRTGRVEIQTLGTPVSDVDVIAGCLQSGAHMQQLLQRGETRGQTLTYNQQNFKDTLLNDFLKQLEQAVNSPKTYPLFDDFTGDLVRLGIKEGRIETSGAQTNRAKHLGLAASLLERLPCFDEASVQELLEIQSELQNPLVNFRCSMIEFSEQIGSAPWDDDFAIEAENTFRSKVEPAVLEIEQQVKENKYLIEVGRRIPEKPLMVPGTSALGMAVGTLSHLGETTLSLAGVGAGAATLALDAWMKHQEKRAKIEANQLYFYYRAGRRLQK